MLASRLIIALGLLGLCQLPAWAGEKPAVDWVQAYSGNYSKGRRGSAIEKVIIHTIEGSTQSAKDTFRSRRVGRREVSAHYIVSLDGSITQMVKDEDRAWHAGRLNQTSIGIEHEGFAHRNTWTPEQYKASARLVRWLCDAYEIPVDREHIQGHAELPGEAKRRSDPGPHFNWELYIKLIQGMAPIEVLSPAAGQVLGQQRTQPLTVRWLGSDDQTSYRVQVEDLDTQARYDSGSVVSVTDRHTVTMDFRHGGRYRWRVVMDTGDGELDLDRESEWTAFAVDLEQPDLSLLGPTDGAFVTAPPRITWRYRKPGVPMAGYRVWVSEQPWQTPLRTVIDTQELNGPADGYLLPNRLEPDRVYYYRVMAHDGRGNLTYSDTRSFRTSGVAFWNPPPDPQDEVEVPAITEGGPEGRGILDALPPTSSPRPQPRPAGLRQ